MRTILGLGLAALAVLLLTAGCGTQERPVQPVLSEREIQDALEFGRSNADQTVTELTRDWTVLLGYGEGEGQATLITPFLRIALLGKRAADVGEKPNRKVIDRILRGEAETLHFKILIFGGVPNFGKNIRLTLKYDGEIRQPSAVNIRPVTEFSRDYMNTASGEVWFRREGIPADAKVTLVAFTTFQEGGRTDTSLCEFPFDLGRYR